MMRHFWNKLLWCKRIKTLWDRFGIEFPVTAHVRCAYQNVIFSVIVHRLTDDGLTLTSDVCAGHGMRLACDGVCVWGGWGGRCRRTHLRPSPIHSSNPTDSAWMCVCVFAEKVVAVLFALTLTRFSRSVTLHLRAGWMMGFRALLCSETNDEIASVYDTVEMIRGSSSCCGKPPSFLLWFKVGRRVNNCTGWSVLLHQYHSRLLTVTVFHLVMNMLLLSTAYGSI